MDFSCYFGSLVLSVKFFDLAVKQVLKGKTENLFKKLTNENLKIPHIKFLTAGVKKFCKELRGLNPIFQFLFKN